MRLFTRPVNICNSLDKLVKLRGYLVSHQFDGIPTVGGISLIGIKVKLNTNSTNRKHHSRLNVQGFSTNDK